MIGNDIVDLALAKKESNWERKGFLDKIYTKNEQLLILKSENPATMVWILWSCKESAYKIYNRQTQIRGYFPLQLECFDFDNIDGFTYGKVRIKDLIFFTKSEIKSEFVHTIAVENSRDFDTIKILKTRKKIYKTNGIPEYFEKESSVLRPVSISHHGRFKLIITF